MGPGKSSLTPGHSCEATYSSCVSDWEGSLNPAVEEPDVCGLDDASADLGGSGPCLAGTIDEMVAHCY